MRSTDEINADQVLYRHLIVWAADQEPRCGWLRAEELPLLTAADVALVCRKEWSAVAEQIDCCEIAIAIGNASASDLIARDFAIAVECACREVIFPDVQDECSRREDERNESDEPMESVCGVSGQFKGSHLS